MIKSGSHLQPPGGDVPGAPVGPDPVVPDPGAPVGPEPGVVAAPVVAPSVVVPPEVNFHSQLLTTLSHTLQFNFLLKTPEGHICPET